MHRTDSRWVFQLPESLTSAGVAPLLCAGITVFCPLMKLNLMRGDKIAVLGLGGLGHLAVKVRKAS